MDPEGLIRNLLSRGVMIEPKAVEYLRKYPSIITELQTLNKDVEFVTLDFLESLNPNRKTTDDAISSRSSPLQDQGGMPITSQFATDAGVRILCEYKESFAHHRGKVADFIEYFSSRYDQLASLLKSRPELSNITSCMHLNSSSSKRRYSSSDRENGGSGENNKVSVIGMVYNKRQSKAGHLIVELEDPTGSVNVILLKDRDVFTKMSDQLVFDEVVGVCGGMSKDGGAIFATDVIVPDVPVDVPWPSITSASNAVFISDIHVGSKVFLKDVFENFLEWIGDENNPTARRVKYLFIAGDLVDGVGVYKGQQKELEITDIIEQYGELAKLLRKVPKRITMFACPGNHDASRDSEPQPPVPEEFAKPLYEIENLVMTSSPSLIKVDGATVLMSHGTSLDGIIDAMPGLRRIGYDRPEQAMIQLLKKRHLMPVYGEKNKTFPEMTDGLVIKDVPNVFHAGHVHSFGFQNYRGIRVLNSSTFQGRTNFQVKVGHHPTPGRIPFMDLRTGRVGVMDFSSRENESPSPLTTAEEAKEIAQGG